MAKKIEKAKLKKVPQDPVESSTAEKEQGKSRHNEMRDTIESIIIALVFAFVFRAYSAEAFVIPTGSMAPTLYGRHKELHCAECGVKYAVGASDELVEKSEYYLPDNKVTGAFCPNCRYYTNLQNAMPFTGDRIIVNKFPFDYGDPGRWDVIVFKYPEASQTNYIKRLVGLPGEEIQISRGDVYARKNEKEPFQILRSRSSRLKRGLKISSSLPGNWTALREPISIKGRQPKPTSWSGSAISISYPDSQNGPYCRKIPNCSPRRCSLRLRSPV